MAPSTCFSEAWRPPQFQEKRSLNEKAILGALGEFQGILGAALEVQKIILGMASHDLSNAKATILGASPGAIPGIDGRPHQGLSFAPALSERFSRVGVVPTCQPKQEKEKLFWHGLSLIR